MANGFCKDLTEERMKYACEIAQDSTESVKVGCVIYAGGQKTVLRGCNYKTEEGLIIHAEQVALRNGVVFSKQDNATMYITKAICNMCLGEAWRAGISYIVMPRPYEFNMRTGYPSKWFDTQKRAIQRMPSCGIKVSYFDVEYKDGVPFVL